VERIVEHEGDMGGFFYNLGRKIGPQLRKANWVYQSLTGTEAESIQAEHPVGRDLARAFLEQSELDADPAVAQLLGDLGGQLVNCVKNRQWPFHFLTVRSADVNAYALPGGFVFLTRPLLQLCQWDRDEIAFVLGHEMGHVLHRHAIDRVMASSVLSVTVGRVLPVGGVLRAPLGSVVATLLNRGYSQDQELAADEMGVRLAHCAGFDARGAVRLLSRLKGIDAGTGLLGSYFSSHPPTEVRVEQVRRLMGSIQNPQ
jgi:predicted Zn-dependent protease